MIGPLSPFGVERPVVVTEVAHPVPAPGRAVAARRFTAYLTCDFGRGPRPRKLSWVINFQKMGTFPLLGVLIAGYANTGTAAWIYLAMHGSYGLVWVIKALAFPDPAWERRITIGAGFNVFFGVLVWCCTIMAAADAQKYFTLRIKRGLITDGMHRYIRHPNYLGEIMIKVSFALMVWHWLPAVVLACVWFGLFAVNMIYKEASTSRYPEWARYRQQTWWLLPPLL